MKETNLSDIIIDRYEKAINNGTCSTKSIQTCLCSHCEDQEEPENGRRAHCKGLENIGRIVSYCNDVDITGLLLNE